MKSKRGCENEQATQRQLFSFCVSLLPKRRMLERAARKICPGDPQRGRGERCFLGMGSLLHKHSWEENKSRVHPSFFCSVFALLAAAQGPRQRLRSVASAPLKPLCPWRAFPSAENQALPAFLSSNLDPPALFMSPAAERDCAPLQRTAPDIRGSPYSSRVSAVERERKEGERGGVGRDG